MWRSRMFWQMFGACGAIILFSVGVTGAFVEARVESNQLEQIKEHLRAEAVFVETLLRDLPAADAPKLWARLTQHTPALASRLTLIAADGSVLADSTHDPETMENHADRPEVQAARAGGVGTATRHSTTVSQPLMYLAVKTNGATGPVAFVRVALPVGVVQEQLAGVRWLIWSAAGLTAAVALVLAFWLARRIALPIQQLTEGAERLAAGAYGHKVYIDGRDEVGHLTQAFNHMSERLATQFAQLEEDRQQLRTVLSSMMEGVVAIDADERVLFANGRAGELLGFAAGGAVGRRFWEVVRHRSIQKAIDAALTEDEFTPERAPERTWNSPSGKSLTVHAARLPGAPPRGAVLVFHDDTDLRRLERHRQEFVANVSHELKTPLAVIKACVETLIDGAVDDAVMRGKFLARVEDQAERLHNLIIDLLALARLESATERFVLQPVALDQLVTSCLEKHRTLAEGKSQRLLASPPANGTPDAWADDEACRLILDNLVDNALKYTPAGGTIRVRWGQDNGHVFVEVNDTGIGIPEVELPRIFERFYRVDKARSRELGGTGLGLSIVKHLVQAMHGSVQAQSRPGEGSTFIVALPCAPAE